MAGKEKIPLLYRGKEIGEAEAERQSLYTCLRIRAPRRDGLWYAWAVGEGGELRIGVLEPAGVEAQITRRVSHRTLSPLGKLLRVELRPASVPSSDSAASPPASGAAFPAEKNAVPSRAENTIWQNAGENPLSVPRFRRQIASTRHILKRGDGDRRYLAFPQEGAFPLPELFCFARSRRINGRPYWVFAFDRKQNPVF